MAHHLRLQAPALAAILGLVLACSSETIQAQPQMPPSSKTPRFSFKVVKAYPHDPTAFTQGLVFADGIFYESTGLNGQSTLRKVTPETGAVIQQVAVEPQYFAEGLALVGDELVQLTWQHQLGFVYDKATLKLLRTFDYPTEGWGMAFDGKTLVMSDGSSRLFFLDPKTRRPLRSLQARDGARPIEHLNELEFVKGELWANVWQTDQIVKIDPATGRVTGWIDLSGLLRREARGPEGDVLNGIAWDKAQDRIFVTGKKWPWLFQIELVPVSSVNGRAVRPGPW
ncbi:MAG: glutaminyl-peptide cyclotransferase [Vicinamibacteria bacterium]|nr:glutaminyl-peptide cyclotransferase [Vicinamibacteria bacterium]